MKYLLDQDEYEEFVSLRERVSDIEAKLDLYQSGIAVVPLPPQPDPTAVALQPVPQVKLPERCRIHDRLGIGYFERGQFFYACPECRVNERVDAAKVSGAPDSEVVPQYEKDVDQLFATAFDADNPAVHAYAQLKMELKRLRAPIPLIIHCPECHTQHVDAPDHGTCTCGHLKAAHPSTFGVPRVTCTAAGCDCAGFTPWNNPDHRSHSCGNCGAKFRVCDRPNTGVECIETMGAADSFDFTEDGKKHESSKPSNTR